MKQRNLRFDVKSNLISESIAKDKNHCNDKNCEFSPLFIQKCNKKNCFTVTYLKIFKVIRNFIVR